MRVSDLELIEKFEDILVINPMTFFAIIFFIALYKFLEKYGFETITYLIKQKTLWLKLLGVSLALMHL